HFPGAGVPPAARLGPEVTGRAMKLAGGRLPAKMVRLSGGEDLRVYSEHEAQERRPTIGGTADREDAAGAVRCPSKGGVRRLGPPTAARVEGAPLVEHGRQMEPTPHERRA